MAENNVSKVKKLDAYLKEFGFEWFEKIEIPNEQNEDNMVVYRGNLEAASQGFQVLVVLDDSIYSMIRVNITPGEIDEARHSKVTEYLNELNRSFKSFKYYLDTDGRIYLDISLVGTAEEFNPELVAFLLTEVVRPHLEEHYPKIMQVTWGTSELHS